MAKSIMAGVMGLLMSSGATLASAQDNIAVRCYYHCAAMHPWDGGARAVCQHDCYYAGGPGNMPTAPE